MIPTPADAVLDLDRAAFGPLKEGAPPSSIVGLYLLFDDGRLITSLATGNEAVDSDILASMLIAVSDFVKDSFPAEGLLSSLDYSDCMILLEWGQRTILAALIRGRPDGELRQELTATLHSIEELYHDVLTDWDGDLDLLAGARGHLEPLMRRHANGSAHREGTYQVTLSGESLPRFYELLLAAHPHAEEPDAR